jgi:hypothetical protein
MKNKVCEASGLSVFEENAALPPPLWKNETYVSLNFELRIFLERGTEGVSPKEDVSPEIC